MKNIFFKILTCLAVAGVASLHGNEGVTSSGDLVQIAIPLSAFSISSLKDDREGMKQLAYTMLTSVVVTAALKLAINKRRPNGGDCSFPSGHTSFAFAGSSYLGFRYGKAYGAPLSVASGFVGYSRVQGFRHYWVDVFAGAAIGIGSAWLFTDKYKPLKFSDRDFQLPKRVPSPIFSSDLPFTDLRKDFPPIISQNLPD